MIVSMILAVLFAHYFADFIAQPRKYAVNKWWSIKALLMHVMLYTICLFIGTGGFFAFYYGNLSLRYLGAWAVSNGIYHFVVDFFTSKAMAKAYRTKNEQLYYALLGADQLIHNAILILTGELFYGLLLLTS